MRVVVLVPYRPSDPDRIRAWEIALSHYESWGFPIYLGDNPGEFARSAAINAASAAAGDWDAAIIADADTVQEVAPIHAGLELLDQSSVVPWRTRLKLSREGTEKLARLGPSGVGLADLDSTDGFAHPDRLAGYPPTRTGSTVMVTRDVWDRVGGFDEGFTGWGFEDQAFRVQLGPLVSLPGTLWHLYHPLAPRDERTKANRKRFQVVRRRSRDPR